MYRSWHPRCSSVPASRTARNARPARDDLKSARFLAAACSSRAPTTKQNLNSGTTSSAEHSAYNVNRWVGIEGEAGNLVGIKQNVTFNGATYEDQHTPCMFGYTGNLVVNPWGSDRPFVPFVTGGLGGLTMLDTDEVSNLGITAKTNFLTANMGGGLKWFASRHWGVRSDYRLVLVDGKESAPAFFGRDSVRYGHRVSAGLVFTY